MTALCALDIDIFSDTRFIKNGNDVYSALMGFCTGDDLTFSHYAGGEYNAMSTVQAYTALSALYCRQNTDSALFDMTNVIVDAYEEKKPDEVKKRREKGSGGIRRSGQRKEIWRYQAVRTMKDGQNRQRSGAGKRRRNSPKRS